MNQGPKRALLYGGAGAVLTAIGLVAANTSAEGDIETLLSSANVQLRLAYAIPANDLQGKAFTSRVELIASAEGFLASVERRAPGLACTAEFRGFASMMKGDFQAAATAYAAAQRCADCQAEQRDVLVFNEARMQVLAGNGEAALATFGRHAALLDRRFGHQRAIEEAGILRALHRNTEAEQRLAVVVADGAAAPMAWLQAGREFERLGCSDRAETVYLAVAKSLPIADFHLARLKLQQGAVDTALELLGRAEAAVPAEVRRLVSEEPDAWRALAEDARFKQLMAPRAATPGR